MLISEVIPVKCSKMGVSVYMKEYIYEDICIYPIEYKKRCYVSYVRQYTFREHTKFMELIGFLLTKVEAVMQKQTFGRDLINQQWCEQRGECRVVAMHDMQEYTCGCQVLFLPLHYIHGCLYQNHSKSRLILCFKVTGER